MRKENQNIENEIEKTLACLDNWERPESNPYFLSKVKEKIKGHSQPAQHGALQWLQPALFAVLIAINVYTVYNYAEVPVEQNTEMNAFFDELGLDESTEDYLSFEQ